jgi:hypothetical protein
MEEDERQRRHSSGERSLILEAGELCSLWEGSDSQSLALEFSSSSRACSAESGTSISIAPLLSCICCACACKRFLLHALRALSQLRASYLTQSTFHKLN